MQWVELAARWIETAGVGVILAGGAIATVVFVVELAGRHAFHPAYRAYRANLGRAILLGLEFLVAGDIIATIFVEATLDSVLALGLVVLIRTFLSFSLETEIEGTFPWRRNAAETT
jgi:uncharacterized membrane protein